jgi:hypothetical protein
VASVEENRSSHELFVLFCFVENSGKCSAAFHYSEKTRIIIYMVGALKQKGEKIEPRNLCVCQDYLQGLPDSLVGARLVFPVQGYLSPAHVSKKNLSSARYKGKTFLP